MNSESDKPWSNEPQQASPGLSEMAPEAPVEEAEAPRAETGKLAEDVLGERLRGFEAVIKTLAEEVRSLRGELEARLETLGPALGSRKPLSRPAPAQGSTYRQAGRHGLSQGQDSLELAEREARQRERDLHRLLGWIEAVERDVSATLGSWRWRLGDRLVRLVEMVLLRRREPLAMDNLQSTFAEIRKWRKGSSLGVARSAMAFRPPPARMPREFDHAERNNMPLAWPLPMTLPEESRQAGLSVVVLNRNGEALLEHLFESFRQHPLALPYEILVVDHASTDGSLEVLARWAHHLPIRTLALQENRSYAESNNRGVREAHYSTLLLLNNDIILTGTDLVEAGMRALQDPMIGVVGVTLRYPSWHETAPNAIQHAGIGFKEDIRHLFYRPYNLNQSISTAEACQVPAVTGAVFFCRRTDFLAVGGLHEGYDYGYEDVDLCLSYRQRLGKVCVLLNQVSAIHDESATQRTHKVSAVRERRQRNIAVLRQRFGYALKRRIRADQLMPNPGWCDTPITVGFVVTEAHADTTVGDYFTAMELAEALRVECGWGTCMLPMRDPRQDAYDLDGVDILIVMIDGYDLSATSNVKPGLIRVAWMRNWFERWAERPWFGNYDLFLCSSQKAADYIRKDKGKEAWVLRIACNPRRFSPIEGDGTNSDQNLLRIAEDHKTVDYCFTGSHWKAARKIEALDPRGLPWSFALYGTGWDKHAEFQPYWRGFLPYGELPRAYRQARLLIDDANHVTKPWASVNSRVFDALASGVLTITNGVEGAAEVFNDRLPTYQDLAELEGQLGYWLDNPKERLERAVELREMVLQGHTYAHRARELRTRLVAWSRERFRFAIKVPAPDPAKVWEWGDYHFALGLRRALTQAGHSVRIDLLPDWYGEHTFADEVALVLRGLSKYRPQPDQINLMWNISHPDKVSDEEYAGYDHVFVASALWADKLSSRLRVPVTTLPQCTDPEVFYPDPDRAVPAHEVLFVGNSRKQFRPIVRHALMAGLPVAVYGTRWEGLIPASSIHGDHVPNDRLRQYYSRCGVLLNDHWPGMREAGFVSNRIFDAAACGALVVTDAVPGIEALFGDTVQIYDDTPEGLKARVDQLLTKSEAFSERCGDVRTQVLAKHTFAHRAEDILDVAVMLDTVRIFPEISS